VNSKGEVSGTRAIDKRICVGTEVDKTIHVKIHKLKPVHCYFEMKLGELWIHKAEPGAVIELNGRVVEEESIVLTNSDVIRFDKSSCTGIVQKYVPKNKKKRTTIFVGKLPVKSKILLL